jgi:hypothetical protein
MNVLFDETIFHGGHTFKTNIMWGAEEEYTHRDMGVLSESSHSTAFLHKP